MKTKFILALLFIVQITTAQKNNFMLKLLVVKRKAKKFFGLFFNGFYLPHELGHAYEFVLKGETIGSYEGEYLANTVAMLWWKKHHRTKELKQCYQAAKKMWAKLPNPAPAGTTIEAYFSKNYEEASANPYIYAI